MEGESPTPTTKSALDTDPPRRARGGGGARGAGVGRRPAQGPAAGPRGVRGGRQTCAALAGTNFRRYYAGQAISMIGPWLPVTAQACLVLQLTHSSTALGGV